jgi:hypothetical protein
MKKIIAVILLILTLVLIYCIVKFFFGPVIGIFGVIAYIYFYPQLKKLIQTLKNWLTEEES